MQFITFREKICEEIQKMVREDQDVFLTDVPKLNDVIRHGISIHTKGEDISPVVYLESAYEQYEQGQKSMEEILDTVRMFLDTAKAPDADDDGIFRLSDWNNMKEHVRMRLINRKLNGQLLKTVPHRDYLNLSIVYYLKWELDEETASSGIDHYLMELYGINEEVLYETAIVNMQKETAYVGHIMDVFHKLGADISDEECDGDFKMLVVSNEDNHYGASMILLEETRKQIIDRFGGPAYLLPASVHELIAIPADSEQTQPVETLHSMVKEINRSSIINDSDYLEDSIYLLEEDGNLLQVA